MKIEFDQKPLNIDYIPDESGQKLPNIDNVPGDGKTSKSHKCDICEKTFTRIHYLKTHKKLHTGESPQCNICEKTFINITSLQSHIKSHTGELDFRCSQCDYKSAWKSSVDRHEKIHTGELPYVCHLCGNGYRHSDYLKRHMANHSEKKKFICDLCNFSTNVLHFLKRHSDGVHKGLKPFQCDDCGKAFGRSGALNCHKRLHTGEKPYKCDECGESFRLLDALKYHKGKHKDQPFFDARFNQHKNKNFHLKRQNGEHLKKAKKKIKIKRVSCEYCEKLFESKAILKVHMRCHTGEKPFACENCQKTFSRLGNLKVHTMIHTGETPFKCKECSQGFRELIQLKKHMKNKHRIEYRPSTPPPEKAFFVAKAPNHPPPFQVLRPPTLPLPFIEPSFTNPQSHPLHQFGSQDSGYETPFDPLTQNLSQDELKDLPKSNSKFAPNLNNVTDTSSQMVPSSTNSAAQVAKPSPVSSIPCAEKSIFGNKDDLENIKVQITEPIDDSNDDRHVKNEEDEDSLNGIQRNMDHIKMEFDNIKKEPIESDQYFNQQVTTFLYKKDLKESYVDELEESISKYHDETTSESGEESNHTDDNASGGTLDNLEQLEQTLEIKKEFNLENGESSINFKNEKELSYKCNLCPKTLQSKKRLQNHMQKFHENGNTDYTCEDCGKSFLSKKLIARHKKTVHGSRIYTCDECGKTFNYPHILKNHLMLHRGEKPFMCDHCSKTFVLKDSLAKHLRNAHKTGSYSETQTLKTQHPCEECGKVLTTESSLKEHKLLHSGVKPFICDQCSQTYSSKRRVQMHKREAHGPKTQIKSHICDVCSMAFKRSCDLKQHKMTHSGDRPAKCHLCVMAFSRKADLRQHILTHTGERPFKCDYCEMSFTRNYHLKQHISKCSKYLLYKIHDQPTST